MPTLEYQKQCQAENNRWEFPFQSFLFKALKTNPFQRWTPVVYDYYPLFLCDRIWVEIQNPILLHKSSVLCTGWLIPSKTFGQYTEKLSHFSSSKCHYSVLTQINQPFTLNSRVQNPYLPMILHFSSQWSKAWSFAMSRENNKQSLSHSLLQQKSITLLFPVNSTKKKKKDTKKQHNTLPYNQYSQKQSSVMHDTKIIKHHFNASNSKTYPFN